MGSVYISGNRWIARGESTLRVSQQINTVTFAPLRDFRNFTREKDIAILKEVAINTHRQQETGNIVRLLPNLRATYGIFLIGRADRGDAG